jgi:hypothetical protein
MIININKMRGVTVVLLTALLLTLAINPATVSADFSEDFSDASLQNWTLYANDGENNDPTIDHTWEIQDGTLVSAGNHSSYNHHNFACKSTEINEEAAWSYDLYGPENDSLWRYSFRISVFPKNRSAWPEIPLANPSHIQVVSVLGLDPDGIPNSDLQIAAAQLQHDPSVGDPWVGWLHIGEISVTEEQLRGWHSYIIEKNSTHLSVHLDDEFLFTGSLHQQILKDYDAICMWTELGSGVMVDILTVTIMVPSSSISQLEEV